MRVFLALFLILVGGCATELVGQRYTVPPNYTVYACVTVENGCKWGQVLGNIRVIEMTGTRVNGVQFFKGSINGVEYQMRMFIKKDNSMKRHTGKIWTM